MVLIRLIQIIFKNPFQIIEKAKNEILCFVCCDIILIPDFIRAVEKIKNEERFLMVGQRWDIDLKGKIDFKNPEWEKNLKKRL